MSEMSKAQFKRQVVLAEFTARYLWPIIRMFAASKLDRRCTKCILPESYVPIDKNGCCLICNSADRLPCVLPNPQSEDDRSRQVTELDNLLKMHCGRGTHYDALMLFSGGKDSTYMLHRIKQEYPELRLLLMIVDNGFLSPIALDNVDAVLSHFDVEIIRYRLKPSFVKKVFRAALTNIKKQKNYSVVDLMDGQMTFDAARIFSARMGIPLILCGLGRIQLQNVHGDCGFELGPSEEINPLVSQLGLHVEDVFTEEECHCWFDRKQWATDRLPRFILPMVVWDPPEAEILKLVTEGGLIPMKSTSPLLTNNQVIPLIGIAEVNQLGYTSFEVEFAKSVREGMIVRDYWLNLFQMIEYSAKTGRLLGPAVDGVLERLSLTRAQLGMSS